MRPSGTAAWTAGGGWSLHARLLSYMEETAIADRFDFKQAAFRGAFAAQEPNPAFASLFATPISVLLCPSDPAPAVQSQSSNGTVLRRQRLHGQHRQRHGRRPGADVLELFPATDGIVFENSKVRPPTMWRRLVEERDRQRGGAEHRQRHEPSRPASPPPLPYQYTLNGSTGWNSTTLVSPAGATPTTESIDAIVNQWMSLTSWRRRAARRCAGRGLALGGHDGGQQPHQRLPAPEQPDPDYVVHWSGFFGPKSHHRGGADVLFADGHVAFLTEATDVSLHRALHSIQGGEVVNLE